MPFEKERTVCFTGHRPEKLPCGGDERSTAVKMLKSMLYTEVEMACAEGFDTFITGMQKGIDLWAGEIVMELMNRYDLHMCAVLPYEGFGSGFKDKDKWLFGRILDNSERIVTICPKYEPGCMNRRNTYMVDNSSLVIAVIGDNRSGTASTVRYAERCGVRVRRIDTDIFSGEQLKFT